MIDRDLGLNDVDRAWFVFGLAQRRLHDLGDRPTSSRLVSPSGELRPAFALLTDLHVTLSTHDRALFLLGFVIDGVPDRHVRSAPTGAGTAGASRSIVDLLTDLTLESAPSSRALFLLGAVLERAQALDEFLPPHPLVDTLGESWSVLGHLFDGEWKLSTADRAIFLLGVAVERAQGSLDEVLARLSDPRWQMSIGEKAVVLLVATALEPSVAVDAGTFVGGSATALSMLCERVVTIDQDQGREVHVAGLPNVEFRCGTAAHVLASVLEEHPETEIVVLDADHGELGIVAEVTEVLRHRTDHLRALIVHDSAMETCRRGLESIRWEDEPMVRGVTLDFLPGSPNEDGLMGGGLALAWLYSGTEADLVARRAASPT